MAMLPRLFALPVEIFQCITSLLDPSELTCLGLTCRALWRLVAESNVQKFNWKTVYWAREKARLLSRIAQDSSAMVVCNGCRKLQSARHYRELSMSNKLLRATCQHLASHVSICKHFVITREMLELALKSHRAQGSAVENLCPFEHSCVWRTPASGNGKVVLNMSSRVVGGDLLVKITYDIVIGPPIRGTFNIPSMSGKGCLHAGLWLKEQCFDVLKYAWTKEDSDRAFSISHRCSYCFTQSIVSATRNKKGILQLQVRAYKFLGGGQAGGCSADQAWRAQVRALPLAKREVVRLLSRHRSLEDIFERCQRTFSKFAILTRQTRSAFETQARRFDTPYPPRYRIWDE